MDWGLIILEYLVFTLPFSIGLILAFHWFIQSKTYERIIYTTAFFLPIVSVLSLLKIFQILELSETPSAFVVANAIFALGFLAFTIILISHTTGRSLAKPNIVEIIGITLLFISSLMLKNPVKIIDYISWGLIGIIAIHYGRGFAYSRYGRKREKHAYVVLCIFSALSILLKLLFYLDILPLKPTIYISLLLMLLALLHGVFTWWKASLLMPKREIREEVFISKISSFRRAITITILSVFITSSISFLGYNEYRRGKDDILKNGEIQVIQSNTAIYDAFREDVMEQFEHPLQYLASTIELSNPTKWKNDLILFYETHKDIFSTVTLMDNKGIIVFTYPFTYSIGSDISKQAHVKIVLERKRPTLSTPFMTVQGFPAIALHIPIFEEGKLIYTLAGVIDIRNLSQKLEKPLEDNIRYLISLDGMVLATNLGTQNLIKEAKPIIKNFENANFITNKTNFTYMDHNFEIITILDIRTLTDAFLNILRRVVMSYGLSVLLFLLLFGISISLLSREEREWGTRLDEALLKELETLRAYRVTQSKLTTLNEFMYTINIEEPTESVVKKFLSTVIALIPKIDKGVLWFSSNGEVWPVASIGYDENLIKRLKFEKVREEKLWTSPTVVEHIGVSGLPQELQDVGVALGVNDIKETLMIPIIVGGHYAGHLSLDIFKEDTHYTKEDISLANTVGKVVSFYLAIQGAMKALKKEVDTNATLAYNLKELITFISKTTFEESEKEFFDGLLNLTLSLIKGGEKGTVLIRSGDKLEYISAVGYDRSILNEIFDLSVEREEHLVGEGEVKIIKGIGLEGIKEGIKKDFEELAIQWGLDKITYTITASFFVNGAYMGGIFIDSFREDMPFLREDIEVMKAVSNLGSLYLNTKKLLSDLSVELRIDNVVKDIATYTSGEKTEEFLKDTFKIIFQSFKSVEYIKGSLNIEERFALFYVDKDVSLFEFSPFSSSKEIENFVKSGVKTIAYETKEDTVEIGINEKGTIEEGAITQLLEGIIAPLKNFFLYKDRAKILGDLIIAFARAIDSKDPYTRTHSENVTKYAYIFGKHLNLMDKELKILVLAGILHDVGKLGISDTILTKKGPLTEEERKEVEKHPSKGFEIVSSIESLRDAAKILRYHHERWDGTGYPDKLKGDAIPYLSRILAVCDAFDAITTDRPYRKAMSINTAIEEIIKNAGTQFDPNLAEKFIALSDALPKAKEIKIEEIIQEALHIR